MEGLYRGWPDLLERAEELKVLSALLGRAQVGDGGALVIEGPPGIGKTRLLEECGRAARDRSVAVLSVRGDEVVMDAPFAAVRELLWELVRTREDAFTGPARLAAPVFGKRPVTQSDPGQVAGVLQGLCQLVANLADFQPLLLLVDDAQWLDTLSLRFMTYLARRASAMTVLLVLALRRGERAQAPEIASLLNAGEVLRPAPLSEAASAELVRGALGPRADEDLCRDCHEATGGNPFYLRELVSALKVEGGRPTVEMARGVRGLGTRSVGRSVLIRLARLGPECQRVAEAMTVLPPGSPLRHAASLAGLERESAELAADRLREADLLATNQSLSFVHPIVREAVAAELPICRRSSLHARAAELLAREKAPAGRVAAHLLAAEPFGEEWVVDKLREAAREALAQSAPDAAVRYLRRALDEPPTADQRLDVLLELGRAELYSSMTQDFAAWREALELADDSRRPAIVEELISVLPRALRHREAQELAEGVLDARDRLEESQVERIEAHLIGNGAPDLSATEATLVRASPYFERAGRGDPVSSVMSAALATIGAAAGRPADEVRALAEAALRDPHLPNAGRAGSSAALCWVDGLDAAARAQEEAFREAERRASLPDCMHFSVLRSTTALRAGDLRAAERWGYRGVELATQLGLEVIGLRSFGEILLELGRAQEAAALFEPFELSEKLLELWFGVMILTERGRIRVALGELERGVADMLEADRRMSRVDLQLSVLIDWVPTAARALVQLGRQEQAQELARRELVQAEAFGAPRRHGIALSLSGLLDTSVDGLVSLEEAVRILERSPARLAHARALLNLGAGLRTRGEPGHARDTLWQALDLAHRCGGVALAESAHEELLAAGARPKRQMLTGPGSLTPAELRVARLAAQGLTNREIAQRLCISTKTVEWQLSHAYVKLGIHRRNELNTALEPAHAG